MKAAYLDAELHIKSKCLVAKRCSIQYDQSPRIRHICITPNNLGIEQSEGVLAETMISSYNPLRSYTIPLEYNALALGTVGADVTPQAPEDGIASYHAMNRSRASCINCPV